MSIYHDIIPSIENWLHGMGVKDIKVNPMKVLGVKRRGLFYKNLRVVGIKQRINVTRIAAAQKDSQENTGEKRDEKETIDDAGDAHDFWESPFECDNCLPRNELS